MTFRIRLMELFQRIRTADWLSISRSAASWIREKLGTAAFAIWSLITKPSMIALAVIIGLGLWFGLHPGVDASRDYMPKRWNESVERLGITPVYPPQEDIYVGDLILQIVESGYTFSRFPDDLSSESEAFVGKYIKIGQLDNVRRYIGLPSFAPDLGDSKWEDEKLTIDQPRLEAGGDTGVAGKVRLTDVLFPVIKISRNDGIGGILSWFSFGMASAHTEEIELRGVQTYAMNPLHTYTELMKFCTVASDYCEDRTVRNILSYTLDRDILRKACTTNGKLRYLYDVKLLAVRQVFTARGLEVRTGRGVGSYLQARTGGAAADSSEALDRQLAEAATAAESSVAPSSTETEQTLVVQAPENEAGAFQSQSSSGLFATGRFSRPLVIGFNAVSVGMKNSSPAWIEENIERAVAGSGGYKPTGREDNTCQS